MTLSIAGVGYLVLGISTLAGSTAELLNVCVQGRLNLETVMEVALCGCVAMGAVLFTYLGLLEVRRQPRTSDDAV